MSHGYVMIAFHFHENSGILDNKFLVVKELNEIFGNEGWTICMGEKA